MKEIWKDIPAYKYYQASTLGRIRSVDRYDHMPRNNNCLRCIKGKILKLQKTCRGYETAALCYNQKKIRRGAHRLVAITFIENPKNKPEVNHKNGIKTDNKIENLEWATMIENKQHAIRTGLWNPKENHTEKVVQMDFLSHPIAIFSSMTEAAKKLNIHIQNISHCCRGKRKSAGGFCWSYLSN